MMSRLTFQNKNRLLLAGTVLLAVLCWKLAIKKTVDALSLHNELTTQSENRDAFMLNPANVRERSHKLDLLLGQYAVDTTVWADQFWAGISGAASRRGVGITYEPGSEERLLSDSTGRVRQQSIQLQAGYRSLVSLLDSLEHTKDIGLVSRIVVSRVEKPYSAGTGPPLMQLTFRAIAK